MSSKLTDQEVAKLLSLLDIGPLMVERATAAIRNVAPDEVRNIAASLMEAKDRADEVRRRADAIQSRMEAAGVAGPIIADGSRRTFAQAQEMLRTLQEREKLTTSQDTTLTGQVPNFIGQSTFRLIGILAPAFGAVSLRGMDVSHDEVADKDAEALADEADLVFDAISSELILELN